MIRLMLADELWGNHASRWDLWQARIAKNDLAPPILAETETVDR